MELSSVKKTKIRAALENKYMSSDEELYKCTIMIAFF
jgi:hypothetical protein